LAERVKFSNSRFLRASLGANVATAGLLHADAVPAWLRILVGGWPADAFLGGTLLAHSATQREALSPPASVPQLPSNDVPAKAASAVPAALLAHARRVADEHRIRTGIPIDSTTLRARLGVPAPLADANAA
jgi:hypothetical protein